MASRSEWKPSYRDLSDDRTISFGAECYVCHARYVSAPQPMVSPLPVDHDPDQDLARAIEAQKHELFAEFERAFHSITIICFRCGNPACPDCWDVDKQMCGACVAARGLIRSPHRGEPAEGPLADGFLRRAEPGEYSEVARPHWLKDLLRAQSDPSAAHLAHLTAPPRVGAQALQPRDSARSNMETYSRVPAIEQERPVFDPLPTTKISASTATPLPGPATPDTLNGPEGEATSGMVTCPRCGTANYDFVTQCSGCDLQLIQICPTCERLNPGHLEKCEQCGGHLTRPAGWSGVHHQIERIDPSEGRRRATAGPARISASWSPGRDAASAAWSSAQLPEAGGAAGGHDRQRPSRSSRRATAAPGAGFADPSPPAVLEVASVRPVAVGDMVTSPHPYETAGPTWQPVMAYDMREPGAARGVRIAQSLAFALERLFTLAVLCLVFALVGAIVMSELSPIANAQLTAYLHFNLKAHVDALLALLNVHLKK